MWVHWAFFVYVVTRFLIAIQVCVCLCDSMCEKLLQYMCGFKNVEVYNSTNVIVLYMCVYMPMYMFVCLFLCKACMHECTMCMYSCMYLNVCVCVCVSVYVFV